MKKYLLLLITISGFLFPACMKTFAQTDDSCNTTPDRNEYYGLNRLLYAGSPNHREIAVKAFELAESSGFIDTSGITRQQILDRLEAGAYSEDFEPIPGIVGEHLPAPWNQGPEYNFYGYYPVSRIPYGSYQDTLSGWQRGLYHGFDPVHGYHWPGTNMTTIEWANCSYNSFSWDHAVDLYRSGHKQEAYECLGHVLHLLADLSVPAHVNVVNHGISVSSVHAGTFYDPDILKLIVDEYELALAGGISITDVYDFIPDLLANFRSALDSANTDSVKILGSWDEYFYELANMTYFNTLVEQYFSPPDSEGHWGNYLNGNGEVVIPVQYFLTPPAEIAGRWAQISVQCTATGQGTVLPEQQMKDLCAGLVPRAVEYSAGLILYFNNYVTGTEEISSKPNGIYLFQNFPNPFNPSTIIRYSVDSESFVELKVYDVIGREVAVLVSGEQPAGDYKVEFSDSQLGKSLSAGVYVYILRAGDYQSVKKMVYLK